MFQSPRPTEFIFIVTPTSNESSFCLSTIPIIFVKNTEKYVQKMYAKKMQNRYNSHGVRSVFFWYSPFILFALAVLSDVQTRIALPIFNKEYSTLFLARSLTPLSVTCITALLFSSFVFRASYTLLFISYMMLCNTLEVTSVPGLSTIFLMVNVWL